MAALTAEQWQALVAEVTEVSILLQEVGRHAGDPAASAAVEALLAGADARLHRALTAAGIEQGDARWRGVAPRTR
jgi:hypothetical protein